MPKHSKNIKQDGRSKWDASPYVKLPYGMLTHPNFLALSGAALKVMLFFPTKHHGFNNGKIAVSFEEMATRLNISKATAHRACTELEYYGFLKLKKAGHFYGRKASEWELTFVTSEGYTPTNDWKIAKPRMKIRKKRAVIKTAVEEILESTEFLTQRRSNLEKQYLEET